MCAPEEYAIEAVWHKEHSSRFYFQIVLFPLSLSPSFPPSPLSSPLASLPSAGTCDLIFRTGLPLDARTPIAEVLQELLRLQRWEDARNYAAQNNQNGDEVTLAQTRALVAQARAQPNWSAETTRTVRAYITL